MSDIVKRLRAIDHSSIEDCFMQSPLFETAADEITRLRAEVERLRAIMNAADALRSAIRKAGVKRRCSELYMSVCAFDSARAALEEKPHD